MMAWRGVFMGLVVGGLALSGCGSTEKYRYKMTVEVETPDGVRSGYAVREIVIRTPPNIPMLGEHRTGVGVRGEAVAVDVAPGKILFALLTGADGEFDFGGRDINFMFKELAPDKNNAVIELWPDKPVTRRPIIVEPTPMLVTFGDLNNPASFRKVEAVALDKVFGAGVRLKRITVQVTNDPTTARISQRLEWLDRLEKYRTDRSNPFTNTLPNEINGLRRGNSGEFRGHNTN